MKKLSEMKFGKKVFLSNIDKNAMGAVKVSGKNTEYYGPTNPSSLTTYVDGANVGSDGSEGSLYGDSWSAVFRSGNDTGTLKISQNKI